MSISETVKRFTVMLPGLIITALIAGFFNKRLAAMEKFFISKQKI